MLKRFRYIFYLVYVLYALMLLYLCVKLLKVPDATEDAFYLYLKETFGGYFGVISFLETYFRSFQIFTILAVAFSFFILFSDFFGKLFLRRKIARLEGEVNDLKAKLYDREQKTTPPSITTTQPSSSDEK
ncbi:MULTISPECIES: hypothetical protein [unclassified Imperialibacter]|uniref:hypothetical protein n=1 Tax=unclassified Imperialibacter TaxID=2629706 RepID=UPI0012570833|nr:MULTISPECIES: hypothetical protein [unclassified Imperialibacter]CAD5271987.1 hypothetical protein IMPERIA89_340604 [Imperialibacter sp. 89]CAD5299160.1 hypothetical protein IMPERIA75_700605 [Imperialibacter sp. 75]VVT35151.1 hypothetical protein IMPR6_700199 [Imperialibacter sp. EC-SDR9]